MIGFAVVLQLVAAIVIAIRSVIIVNRMSADTRHAYALAWIAVGGTAASCIASTLAGQTAADLHTALLLASAAVVLVMDKRRR